MSSGYLSAERTAAAVLGGDVYRSPYASYSVAETPINWRNVLYWCQNIFCNNGTLVRALDRTVSYFITDLDLGAPTSSGYISEDEREKWENLFRTLSIVSKTREANLDVKCYGNYFVSLNVPFRRLFFCPKCRTMTSFQEFTNNPVFRFSFSNFEFCGRCPKCKYSGRFDIQDEPNNQPEALSLKLWPPTEIELVYDMLSGDCDYVWRIPEDYKTQIRSGSLYQLERASKPIIEAIKHNHLYRFNKNMIFHGKETGPTGLRTRGWGLSPLIYNSRQIWYVEMLHRSNEVICLEHVVPLRMISPDIKSFSSDQAIGHQAGLQNLGMFRNAVERMVRVHRRNPTSVHTMPFPVNFQQIGGDANQLVPYELINQGYDVLLNAVGAPVELQRGTLNIQAMPVALRVFEAQNSHMVQQNNELIAWAVSRVCEVLNWEPVRATYRRVQHADDLQRQLNILQMAISGRVSETDALRTLGLEYRDQRRLIAEEARYDQELQARMQEEMDQAAFGQQIAKGMPQGGGGAMGQPAPGQGAPQAGAQMGAPAQGPLPPGQSVSAMLPSESNPVTPEEMESIADSIAQTLLTMPHSQRISELRAMKNKNPTMHKMVKGKLEEIRSKAKSQGGSMLIQQSYGGG